MRGFRQIKQGRVDQPPSFRLVIALVACVICPLLPASPLPQKADRVVDYTISVTLEPKSKMLTGRERIVWRNPSDGPVPDLWFHLYLNAFKNSKTTFHKRLTPPDQPSYFGWIDVTSLRLADGTDLLKRATFERPDDGNPDDQTVMRTVLPQPVPAGGEVAVVIEFKAKLPRLTMRTGYDGDTFMVAQWFPKLGVYEPAGMRGRRVGGWNCHQFHSRSEFYADFGHYAVEITTPSEYKLGAVGQLRSKKQARGQTTCLYEQDDVHDFAWTASPTYVVSSKKFVANAEVSSGEYQKIAELLGRPLDQVQLTDVDLVFLMRPENANQVGRYERAARAALKWFGLWYGRYPYPVLTIVDPVSEGGGGMEYPTLFTAGSLPFLDRWPFNGIRLPELITVHETAHQWWYGLAANNEFEEAWLDEGIASYATSKLVDVAYPDNTFINFMGFKVSELDFDRMQNGPSMNADTSLQPAWTYLSNYAFYSYEKPTLTLRTLEGLLGEKTMARVMRAYQERWRFRHPSSADFIDTADEVSGQDLAWFFDQFLKGSGTLDYEVSRVSTTRVSVGWGTFSGKQGHTPRRISNKSPGEKASTPEYRSEVVVRRLGENYFPVDLLLRFEDGRTMRRQWDGRSRWAAFTVTSSSRLESAQLDPERRVFLDVNWTNNSRRVAPDSRASWKLASRLTFWFQNLLSILSFVG